jgi:hypothetical protein
MAANELTGLILSRPFCDPDFRSFKAGLGRSTPAWVPSGVKSLRAATLTIEREAETVSILGQSHEPEKPTFSFRPNLLSDLRLSFSLGY